MISRSETQIRPLAPADQQALPPAGVRPREVLQNPAVSIYAEGWGREGDVGVVCVADGKDVGFVTTAAISPSQGVIAMGYVHRDFVEPGSRVTTQAGPAAVSGLPFGSP